MLTPPPISRELIAWLESIYQDKCPASTDTDRQVWISVGRAEVVRKIKDVFQKQSDNILNR